MSDQKTFDVKLIHETRNGTLVKSPARIQFADGRIWFLKSPFALKDEIKAMRGSRWHGFDDTFPWKIWSVLDCFRNHFQLGYLMGRDVYEWFDRDLIRHKYRQYRRGGEDAEPMLNQLDMADAGLTYHYQIWGAEMGTGKTLAAQMVIEHSDANHWYWVGPKRSLTNIEREFRLWDFDETAATVEFMTYERLVRVMDEWQPGNPLPQGVVFDESSRLKHWESQRSKAAQLLADRIREAYAFEGFVIEMSGTPSPKRPTDWWSQCEIAWPGFLREGSTQALERRLAFMVQKSFDSGTFWDRIGWRDDERKCETCGEYDTAPCHQRDNFMEEHLDNDYHPFKPSKNEVAFMYERLKGLVLIQHLKDCKQLPEKRYRQVICKPTSSILRVAKAIADSAPNAMTAMTLLRELSDGFQYREESDGTTKCNHCPAACGQVDEWVHPEGRVYKAIDMLDEELVAKLEKRKAPCPVCGGSGERPKTKRVAREIPCPKDRALRDLLEENEETGRIVIFAGFTGSLERVIRICCEEQWHVVRCDGKQFEVIAPDGSRLTDVKPLDFWADLAANARVAFVAHPESGGMSFTLVEARMEVFWSNSFKPEYRIQSEARVHRPGMDENRGCMIVDLIHLPTDERVLEIIQENRRLELMTMGEVVQDIDWAEKP